MILWVTLLNAVLQMAQPIMLKAGVNLMKDLQGKIFADKGYIGKKELTHLLESGLLVITGIRKKMKNKLLLMWDKILLKKRSLIESIFNVMKNSLYLEHSRHRNVVNAEIYYITTVIAYCWKPNKPKINFINQEMNLLQQLGFIKLSNWRLNNQLKVSRSI